ncbi:hypothetical protein BB559_000306 [Furculomyces boomerangus]|uniref:Uncharacterized protein n=1 Tax=Furculomyces boomerangus TaxID=61424 RepID=A0A2T9Z5M4_9FUNG|nr:hypothetical protein BB559_000306 [Furculomyces boomerangus]
MNTISSYVILSQIFILSKNPEVRLVSRNFYEISKIVSVRANFLIHKFGKDKVLDIRYNEFVNCYDLLEDQELVLNILQRNPNPDQEISQNLFQVSVRRRWIKVLEYLLDLFVDVSKEKFQAVIQQRNHQTEIQRPTPKQKEIRNYIIPTIDINTNRGICFRLALSYKQTDIVKKLLNAYKIIPKFKFDVSKTEILFHQKVSMEYFSSNNICDLFEEGGLELLKLFFINGLKSAHIRGADVHADQDWALGMASKSGHLGVVKYLIENGANIKAREDFALGIACRNCHFEIVKYLVENGADLKAENHWNQIFEEKNNHIEIINYLLERGLDFYNRSSSISEYAIGKGRTDIVKLLVENGADVHANNDFALRWASENGHSGLVKCLVENGADVHANNDQALRSASMSGHLEVVKYLVDSGSNVDAQDGYALRWASANGHFEVVKYLVGNGTNIHEYFNQALESAIWNGHLEVVKYLVENGANIHSNNKEALQSACKNGHLNVVKYLAEKSVDINRINEFDFRFCEAKGHFGVVKYLRNLKNNGKSENGLNLFKSVFNLNYFSNKDQDPK